MINTENQITHQNVHISQLKALSSSKAATLSVILLLLLEVCNIILSKIEFLFGMAIIKHNVHGLREFTENIYSFSLYKIIRR